MKQNDRKATVTLAMRPDNDTVAKIAAYVKSRGVSKISYEIDENIIGGIIIQIGSVIYDGSVRSRLDNIKTPLDSQADTSR